MNPALPLPLAEAVPPAAPFLVPVASPWLGLAVILLLLFALGRAIQLWARRADQSGEGRSRLARFAARAFPTRDVNLFSGLLLLLYIGAGLAAGAGRDPEENPESGGLRMLLTGLAVYGAAALLALGLFRRNRRTASETLGWDVRRVPRDAARALGLYALLIPGGLLVNLVYQVALMSLGVDPKPQDTVDLMASDLTASSRLSLTLLIVVLAPAAEEIVFRGVLLPAFVRRAGPAAGVFLVSTIFALIHLNTASIALLFYLGAAMSIAYLHTGSIVTPIVIHAAFNAVNLALLFVLGR